MVEHVSMEFVHVQVNIKELFVHKVISFFFRFYFFLIFQKIGICNPPCLNSGVCINGTCQCIDQAYQGVQCEIPNCVSLVFPYGCMNGGNCVRPGTWTPCDCPSGFAGPTCNVSIATQQPFLFDTPPATGTTRSEGKANGGVRSWNQFPHSTGFWFMAPTDMQ